MPYDPADWDTADDTAHETAQNFFTDANGAHISTTPGDPDTGDNVLIDSTGMYVRDGTVNKAQFTDPTIIGKTSAGEANIRIGNIPNWSDGIGIFNGANIGLLLQGSNSGGTINSSSGCYLVITDGIGITPPLQTPFNVLNSSRQSDFCIGGYHVYAGTIVKTVSGTLGQLWTMAEFKSNFHVDTDTNAKYCGVAISNGEPAVLTQLVSAECWLPDANPGWYARWGSSVSSGARRFNYVVAVPNAYSTV